MKTLKDMILEAAASTGFPEKNAWQRKAGTVSIQWNCGNTTAKEYLRSSIGAFDTQAVLWFGKHIDRIDTISIQICKCRDGVAAYVDFIINNGGGIPIRFEGVFDSVKEAKSKMYDLFCKIRDDKDILRKMNNILNPDPDKYRYLTFDEMMNL